MASTKIPRENTPAAAEKFARSFGWTPRRLRRAQRILGAETERETVELAWTSWRFAKKWLKDTRHSPA